MSPSPAVGIGRALRVLDLFSGIGGFSLACELINRARRARLFDTVQFVELDPFCQQILSKRFPMRKIHGDIKTFAVRAGEYDLICAGFPCQPFSSAGKKHGEADARFLWPELYRVICQARPRYIVLENVPGLLSIRRGEIFKRILKELCQAGYDAEWEVISAADVGGIHLRERVWFVAYFQPQCHPENAGNIQDCPASDGSLNSNASNTDSFRQLRSQAQQSLRDRQWHTRAAKCPGGAYPDQTFPGRTVFTDSNHWGMEAGLRGSGSQTQSRTTQGPHCILAPKTGEHEEWQTTQPRICGSDDGISSWLDNPFLLRQEHLPEWIPVSSCDNNDTHYAQRLQALGNALVPQVAAIALNRVLELETDSTNLLTL